MRAYERLLKYVKFDTASCESQSGCPSSEGQLTFARALVEEMRALGVEDAHVDRHGYVYGTLPANCPSAEVIGLIAHMDTVDDLPAVPNPRIVEHYDGGDIVLNQSRGDRLSPAQFPFLKNYVGKSLIVTDGATILGADDKAGVAEIMTLLERLTAHPERPHGKLRVGFTPDEEIGRGADLFDVAGFGADFAYTVDGGELGGIEYENFNAASALVEINGVNIHPGSAKDKMKNALLIGVQFAGMLPPAQTPAHTEGYEGFFHLIEMSGATEKCVMKYIIRDHDRGKLESRKALLTRCAAFLNELYGENTVNLTLTDSYYNMREQLENGHMHVVERARRAMRAAGVTPYTNPIRGGTDGARLSFMGLPCPNLSTGAMNGHGRHECACIESMDKMVDVLEQLVLCQDEAKK